MTRFAVPILVMMLTAVAWAADVVTLEEDDLSALRVRLELRKMIRSKLRLKATAGYREQELQSNVTRGSWFVGLGFDPFFWGGRLS